MGEILSHAEVEAILSAIEPSRPAPRSVPAGQVAEAAAWERHDFRRPETLQGVPLRVVQALHAGICRRWTAQLQSLLQTPVEVHPVGACRSSASEFFKAEPSAHVICQVTHTGSAAESLLVWNLELIQLLIAKMLGGTDGTTNRSADHALTNIELRLLVRFNDAVLGELASLLGESLTVGAVLQSLASIPERLARFPSVWFSFEVVVGGTRGLIHLGIPGLSLSSEDDPRNSLGLSSPAEIPAGIQHVSVQVTASLTSLKLTAADLAALQVGDIVMTDMSPRETVTLTLDGRNLCDATIGTHLGRKALRLTADPGR